MGEVEGERRASALLLRPAANLALIPLLVVMSLAAFLSLQELLLALSARVIIGAVDSAVRGSYALGAVRNLWLLFGGAFLVGLIIYGLDFAFKHWRSPRFGRLALRVLAAEIALILAQMALVG